MDLETTGALGQGCAAAPAHCSPSQLLCRAGSRMSDSYRPTARNRPTNAFLPTQRQQSFDSQDGVVTVASVGALLSWLAPWWRSRAAVGALCTCFWARLRQPARAKSTGWPGATPAHAGSSCRVSYCLGCCWYCSKICQMIKKPRLAACATCLQAAAWVAAEG